MKSFLLSLALCLLSLNIQAQTEHLKFMGIPLTGSITSFQSKLQAKGVKYDAAFSSQLKAPCRAFRGVFSGEKADIYVYYNEKTKIVYRAKAVITYPSKEIGQKKFENFRYLLMNKYQDTYSENGEKNNLPTFSIGIPNSKRDNVIGGISVYFTVPDYSFINDVYLHLDYEDYINTNENDSMNMDDL